MIGVWILCPIRLTTDLGPDTWGFADVEAAVAGIPVWIKNVGWNRPSVDVDKWLVSGHSNGGRYNGPSHNASAEA